MTKDIMKTLSATLVILASIATIVGTCIAAIALIPAFGSWLSPQEPIQYVVTSEDNGSPITSPNIIESSPTSAILENSNPTSQESSIIPTNLPMPRIYNFSACNNSCNGNNSITTFPSAITKIYLEWDYENIPYGAKYIRKWTMNGKEWIKYDCTWTGNENGRESVKLTEPKGLHSGTWELTVIVDGNVLLNEKITVSGDWDYWDPAGTLNSCYGTTD